MIRQLSHISNTHLRLDISRCIDCYLSAAILVSLHWELKLRLYSHYWMCLAALLLLSYAIFTHWPWLLHSISKFNFYVTRIKFCFSLVILQTYFGVMQYRMEGIEARRFQWTDSPIQSYVVQSRYSNNTIVYLKTTNITRRILKWWMSVVHPRIVLTFPINICFKISMLSFNVCESFLFR